MTTYEKQLISAITQKYGQLDTEQLLEKLMQIGVVDYSMCKVLAVRRYVGETVEAGEKKIDAMWMATERFACSYEYVRKCIYYYKDVNV